MYQMASLDIFGIRYIHHFFKVKLPTLEKNIYSIVKFTHIYFYHLSKKCFEKNSNSIHGKQFQIILTKDMPKT